MNNIYALWPLAKIGGSYVNFLSSQKGTYLHKVIVLPTQMQYVFPRENACIGGEASSHRREPVQCRLKRIPGEEATHRGAGFTTRRTFISRAGGKIKRKVARNFRKSRSLPWHKCISALITAICKNFDDNRNSNTIYFSVLLKLGYSL